LAYALTFIYAISCLLVGIPADNVLAGVTATNARVWGNIYQLAKDQVLLAAAKLVIILFASMWIIKHTPVLKIIPASLTVAGIGGAGMRRSPTANCCCSS
jgi:hypothetical protein